MSSVTQHLSDSGVSIWLDDLSRDRIRGGALQRLIERHDVMGITTNPTIFATAVAGSDAYDEQLGELARAGTSAEDAVFALTTHDVAAAADILRPIHDRTAGHDGWVSIEVGADAAYDAGATIAEARRLAQTIARPNVFIKIPATAESLRAITDATAEGISVNVTLIFGLERYRRVIDAYLTGIERARDAGRDLAAIRSVASFFVSRVDAEIDARLDAIGSPEAAALRGQAGVANARLAYEVFQREFAGERALGLLNGGANAQRPLWASTGVKDPGMPDTRYVVELVARDVVNTMPEKTLLAVADHGQLRGDTVTGTFDESRAVLDRLAAIGVSYAEVTEQLERDGVAKFQASGRELLSTVAAALEAHA